MKSKLIIEKLIIEGENYRRTLPFIEGVNLIEGEMYSGKSLVLKLINYLLGKKENINSKVQVELKQYCDKAYLQIRINGNRMTIERNLWRNTQEVLIYCCEAKNIEQFSPKIMDLGQFSDYLLECLNIESYYIPKHKIHSEEKVPDKISFRDFMRYVYVDQHSLGTPSFMKNDEYSIRPKNKMVFKILFNLVEYDKDDLSKQIIEIENEMQKIKQEIEGLQTYLREMKVDNKIEIERLYAKHSQDLMEYENQKKEIMKKLQGEKSKIDTLYSKIKKQIISIIDEKSNLEQLINQKEMELYSKEELLYKYKKESKELEATAEAYNLLPKKQHKYRCPVCSNEIIEDINSNINPQTINDSIMAIRSKENMLISLISQNEEELETLERKRVYLKEDLQIFNRSLEKYKSNINLPYVSELEGVNSILLQLNDKLNRINENIKIFNRIEQQQIAILNKEKIRDNLKKELQDLNIEEAQEATILREISEMYASNMEKLSIKVNSTTTYISDRAYIPYYNDASVMQHESGGILVCMQVAYLIAILEYQKQREDVKHPGIIILDTIGKYLGTTLQMKNEKYTEKMIMDPVTYEELYKLLYEVGKDYQVFIVDNIPPEAYQQDAKYTFYHNDLTGLIDLSKNEKLKKEEE